MENKQNNYLILFVLSFFTMGLMPFFEGSFRGLMAIGNLYSVVGFAVFYLGLVLVVVVGLFKRNTGSFLFAYGLLFLIIFQKIKYCLIFGTYGEGLMNSFFLLSVVVFLYFSQKRQVRIYFDLSPRNLKGEKIILWSSVIIFLGMFILYFVVVLPKKNKFPHAFQSPSKVVYLASTSAYSINDYDKKEILGWELFIPKTLSLEEPVARTEGRVSLTNPQQDLIIMSFKEGFFGEKKEFADFLKRIHGLKSNFDLGRKIFYEKVGMVYLIFRSILPPGDVYELSSNNVHGFLCRSVGRKSIVYNYSLFDSQNHEIHISFLILKNDVISEEQIKDIVLSLKFIGGKF